MKKRWLLLTAAALSSLTLTIAACTQTQISHSDSQTSSESSETASSVYALKVSGSTTRTLEIGEIDTIDYVVTKDNAVVTGTALFEIVQADITGTAVSFNVRTKQVSTVEAGEATVKLSLKGHSEVVPVSIVYTVAKPVPSFWSGSLRRGDVTTEENGAAFTTPGQQPMIAVAEASVNFVFRGSVAATAFAGNQSFGIGSFVDAGDTALWIGLRNDNGQSDGIYSVYIRNFYRGWGSATTDGSPAGYVGLDFGGKDTIAFEIVRMGTEYRYEIGSYHGTYTDDTNYTAATYPGFFVQEHTMSISGCTYVTEEAKVKEAFDAYGEKEAAVFTLSESAITLVRGTSHTFSYTSYPAGASFQPTWSLNTEAMTAGASGTAISEDGVLTLAQDAAGALTVKVSDGKTERTVEVTILQQSADAENEFLKVTGGVTLHTDGSITFPKTSMNIDGVVNETAYAEAAYSANLKQKVIGDFSIKFTVSSYETTAEYPKLMVSLGGMYEQFYIAYKTDGTCRVETFALGLTNDGRISSSTGNWINSAAFENFDPAAAHTFEIVVKDGVYSVYLDDEERTSPLTFNIDNTTCTPVRRAEDFSTEQPIRISTKGVAATVSGISVTNGSADDFGAFHHYNENTVINGTDDGFMMKFGNYSWSARDNYCNRVVKTSPLPANFDMRFKLLFSNAMTDAKFGITFGDVHIMINNKTSGISANVNGVGADWQDSAYTAGGLEFDVRIVRVGNNLKVYLGGQLVKEFTHDAIDDCSFASFWGFNGTASEETYTATVSGFVVTEYTEPEGAE